MTLSRLLQDDHVDNVAKWTPKAKKNEITRDNDKPPPTVLIAKEYRMIISESPGKKVPRGLEYNFTGGAGMIQPTSVIARTHCQVFSKKPGPANLRPHIKRK